MNNELKKERLLELLADQALFGLSEQESKELKKLQNAFPELKNDISFEQTAAAIDLGFAENFEPMPQNLQAKILADADNYFGTKSNTEESLNDQESYVSGGALPTASRDAAINTMSYDSPKPSFMQWLGWGVAAFACIALVANIWLTRINPTEVVQNPVPIETPKAEPTLAEKKQQFIASANDLVRSQVASPDNSGELKGEITWSNTKQEGYITLRGLPENDISKETYQLWIFDETQDEKTPINGGVFNVDKNDEIIIPIDAEIQVRKPKMFAVTVEKPGGVVVSKRDKIVALAKVEA